MHIPDLHDWTLTPPDAITLQKSLAAQLIDRSLDVDAVRIVAGVDVSVKPDPITGVPQSQAAITVLNFPALDVIEVVRARIPTPFPYISGLLSFREGAVIIAAARQLTITPDVFIFDGMGRAHPRRLGIAAHIGLWFNAPTIGCGKTLLVGKYTEPALERGAYSLMTHRGEVIGAALRTRDRVKPVYISAGHLMDLDSALALTMRCVTRYRLPEPIRAAHNAAGAFDAS